MFAKCVPRLMSVHASVRVRRCAVVCVVQDKSMSSIDNGNRSKGGHNEKPPHNCCTLYYRASERKALLVERRGKEGTRLFLLKIGKLNDWPKMCIPSRGMSVCVWSCVCVVCGCLFLYLNGISYTAASTKINQNHARLITKALLMATKNDIWQANMFSQAQ